MYNQVIQQWDCDSVKIIFTQHWLYYCHPQNIELQVQMSNMKKELADKDALLMQAKYVAIMDVITTLLLLLIVVYSLNL